MYSAFVFILIFVLLAFTVRYRRPQFAVTTILIQSIWMNNCHLSCLKGPDLPMIEKAPEPAGGQKKPDISLLPQSTTQLKIIASKQCNCDTCPCPILDGLRQQWVVDREASASSQWAFSQDDLYNALHEVYQNCTKTLHKPEPQKQKRISFVDEDQFSSCENFVLKSSNQRKSSDLSTSNIPFKLIEENPQPAKSPNAPTTSQRRTSVSNSSQPPKPLSQPSALKSEKDSSETQPSRASQRKVQNDSSLGYPTEGVSSSKKPAESSGSTVAKDHGPEPDTTHYTSSTPKVPASKTTERKRSSAVSPSAKAPSTNPESRISPIPVIRTSLPPPEPVAGTSGPACRRLSNWRPWSRTNSPTPNRTNSKESTNKACSSLWPWKLFRRKKSISTGNLPIMPPPPKSKGSPPGTAKGSLPPSGQSAAKSPKSKKKAAEKKEHRSSS